MSKTAKDHAVETRLGGANSLNCTGAARAIASNSDGASWLNDANAHAMLERFCGVEFVDSYLCGIGNRIKQ